MSSDRIALSVQGVGKQYRITSSVEAATRLADVVARRLRNPLRRSRLEIFEALFDVSFDVHQGEALGIIGRNGAGKSTLLKIISRITEPTSGRIELYGRVGSLLEVGTGFHPELTGRENVYLNGSILGMKKAHIDRQFDSIVSFSEVSKFLDTPVKRYSSGMYVRLAFAVAAHLNPDILIVDEVLSVGDADFQKKCLGKMGEVASEEGRTVLFVSHNMTAIQSFCTRCIYIADGRVAYDGSTADAITQYLAGATAAPENRRGEFDLSDVPRGRSLRTVLRHVRICDGEGNLTDRIPMGEGFSLVIDVEGLSVPLHLVRLRIVAETGSVVVNLHTRMKPLEVFVPGAPQEQVVLHIPRLPLLPGQYWLELAVREGNDGSRRDYVDLVERAARLEILPADVYGSGFEMLAGPNSGFVFLDPRWEIKSNGTVMAASTGS